MLREGVADQYWKLDDFIKSVEVMLLAGAHMNDYLMPLLRMSTPFRAETVRLFLQHGADPSPLLKAIHNRYIHRKTYLAS